MGGRFIHPRLRAAWGLSWGKACHPGGPGFAWLKVFHLCSLRWPWRSLLCPPVMARGDEPTLWGHFITLSLAVLGRLFFLSGLFIFLDGIYLPAVPKSHARCCRPARLMGSWPYWEASCSDGVLDKGTAL